MTHLKYPKPWSFEQTGADVWLVFDANDRKLFYVCSDAEGEGKPGDGAGPTVLNNTDDDEEVLQTLAEMLGSKYVVWP